MNSKKESNDQNGMQNKNQNHQPFERKQTNLEDLFGFGFEEETKRFFEKNEKVVDQDQIDRNTFERNKKDEDEILFESYEENKDSQDESDEHKGGNQEEILSEPYEEKVENIDGFGDEKQNQEEEILFEPYEEEEFEETDKGENWKERIANFMAPKGKKEQRDQAGINRQILKVAYLFAGLFLGLMIYIGYFVEIDSKDVITNPRNQRQDMLAKSVVRGNIESIDGEVLAKTEVDEDGNETRVYPFEHLYAHVVG
ncbi:MAG: hypothetical protein IAC13_01940, partial [Firmicutes bacterium]|nr:hypothetical protein [Candidatus Scybalomonas excrementavium]